MPELERRGLTLVGISVANLEDGRAVQLVLPVDGADLAALDAALDEAVLEHLLGCAAGRHIHALAHNRDPRRVQTRSRRRSIGSQRALGRRPKSLEEIDATLVAIVDRVARRLRAARRVCRTVVLRLRFDDFSRATRSLTLSRLTGLSEALLAAARTLLASATPLILARGITLVGISLTNLEDVDRMQLSFTDDWRPDALDAALDEVRDRYGSKVITRGLLVGRDPGVSMPLLPD
jgi:DNA polymerase-4